MRQREQMPPSGRTRDARALRRQGRIQALALGIKTLQHGHAFDHALNDVGFCDGHEFHLLRDDRTLNPIIAQTMDSWRKRTRTPELFLTDTQ